jgi:hypothetical protein
MRNFENFDEILPKKKTLLDDEQPLGNPGPHRHWWWLEAPQCGPQVCSADL